MNQSKIDSLMEAVTNTAIGFVVSLVTWTIVCWAMALPMSWGENLLITAIFTVVSVARSYVLRRAFNGRSVWTRLKTAAARSAVRTKLTGESASTAGGPLAASAGALE